MQKIIAQQSDFSFDNQLLELSTGQFASFFQMSNISNARRILRRIYSQPGNSGQYKKYQIKVRQEDGQYLATITPISSSPLQSFNTSSIMSPEELPANLGSEPFCDWLTVHQNYNFPLPSVNGGCVISLKSVPENSGGHFDFGSEDIEYLTTKFISHGGSFDTNLQLRVFKGKMTLSGNVGRFSRPDNLFGFSLLDCVKKANRILDSLNLGLPHFTPGEYIPPRDRVIPCKKPLEVLDPLRPLGGKDLFIAQNAYMVGYEERITRTRTYQIPKYGYIETRKHRWTGAWFSQIHFTKNLKFSNSSEAALYVDWACRQNPFGMNVSPHYGQGVSYGKGSAYLNPKIYLKGLEILKNKKYKVVSEEYKDNLLKFINNSIVRFEIEYKKYLEKNGLKYLGDFMDRDKSNVLYVDFKNRLDRVLGNDIDFFENLEKLTPRRAEQFLSWTRGRSFDGYSERTQRRLHRYFKEVLNVDTTVPYHEGTIGVSIRKLTIQELGSPPEFYETSELDNGFRLVG